MEVHKEGDAPHELIDQYLLGTLSTEARAAFEQKLADPAFRKEVEFRRDLLQALRAGGRAALKAELSALDAAYPLEEGRPAGPSRRFPFLRWSWAAAAILLLTVGLWWWTGRPSKADPEALFAANYEPYPNQLRPAYRDRAGVPDDALSQAMVAYDAGAYAQALHLLQALPDSLAGTPGRDFYLAHCLLATGQTREAAALWQAIGSRPDGPYTQEADWYEALARLKLGETAAAQRRLQEMAADPAHRYQQRAAALLTEFP